MEVKNADSISDKIYKDLKKQLILSSESININVLINLILIGRALERIDHITNVCEYINFKVSESFNLN